jgi:cytochrome c oxidase cbb3-type subunit 4
MLYGYFYYIYAAERRGDRDYEKYRNIALDDNLDSTPLETTSPWEKKEKKEIKHV